MLSLEYLKHGCTVVITQLLYKINFNLVSDKITKLYIFN